VSELDVVTPGGPERETLGQRVAVGAFRSMERIAMRWPERPARLLFDVFGAAAFQVVRGTRATVAGNLAHVIGRPADSPLVQDATREAFSLYSRFWYEAFHVRTASKEEMNRRFVIEGLENIDRGIERGRGAICVLPHMGNWDAAGKFLAVNGYRMAAVAEELKPRRLFEFFLHHRRELGMHIVPLAKNRHVGVELARLLSDNWTITLVADRDLGGKGVEVEMFGAPRKLPAGPALLSLSTGAPLLPSSVYTTEDGWFCVIEEPVEIERTGSMRQDVATLTREVARSFERMIAARPTDWHMFQPAWDDVAGASPAVDQAPPDAAGAVAMAVESAFGSGSGAAGS
jgi:phosphatidylinositol dimannoside acyltransferase